MKKVVIGIVIGVVVALLGWALWEPMPGPGMTVGLDSAIPGKLVDVLNGMMPSGKQFIGAKNIGPTYKHDDPLGSTFSGAAPDGRDLPEWVEFEWKEWPYPYPEQPKDPIEEKLWSDKIHELSRTLPHKKFRVAVRNRIPKEVVDEAVAAVLARNPKELPEKMIRIYFIWHPDGIWFRWSLMRGSDVLSSGGDVIPGRPEEVGVK